jgi:nucleotide-binding universal stress UspA family protein
MLSTIKDTIVRVEMVVREGDAATEISNAVESHHADLVIMTTHGRSTGARWLSGSIWSSRVTYARG